MATQNTEAVTYRVTTGIPRLIEALAEAEKTSPAGIVERLVVSEVDRVRRTASFIPPELRDKVEGLRARERVFDWLTEQVEQLSKTVDGIDDRVTEKLAQLIWETKPVHSEWRVACKHLGSVQMHHWLGRTSAKLTERRSAGSARARGSASRVITSFSLLVP